MEYDLLQASLKVEFFDSSDVSLGSATSGAETTRNVSSFFFTGVTTPENIHYVVVTVIPNSVQVGKLFGIRILETEGTL